MAANMGSMRILIKGGKVVNDDFTQEADVYIENGIIQQVTAQTFAYKLPSVIRTLTYQISLISHQTVYIVSLSA